MKRFSIPTLLLLSFFFLMGQTAEAQKCKVLKEELVGSYKGKCKKGLAHGKGFAEGKDSYRGRFKHGLPHGKGEYFYDNGAVHKGQFEKGLREGEGKYTFKVEDRDSITTGIWENDIYKGPKPGKPYKVLYTRNLDKYRFNRKGDGASLRIDFTQNGMRNASITEIDILTDSGNRQFDNYTFNFDDIEFPLRGKITYNTPNKMKTSLFNVIFEFVLNEPGEWTLMLGN